MKTRPRRPSGSALPPYLQIAHELRRRVDDGELGVGERFPSTRRIAREWGVAIATATKALAWLRDEGVLEARSRVGTMVAGRARSTHAKPDGSDLTRDRIVRVAIALADGGGLPSLSMRAVAAKLDAPTMSLYRHVARKEDLLHLMTDTAFGEVPLPVAAPRGIRARLEVAARMQWALYRAHPWLAQVVTLTRPLPLPNMLRHADWALAALDGLGLDAVTMLHVHMSVFNFVRGIAINLESERQTEAETGMTEAQWASAQEASYAAIAASGKAPTFAKLLRGLAPGYDLDLDAVFEFGLTPLLDGVAALVRRKRR